MRVKITKWRQICWHKTKSSFFSSRAQQKLEHSLRPMMMISSSSPRPDEQVLRHGAQISDAAPTHAGRPTRDTRPTAQSQGWRLVAALHKVTEDDVQLNRMPGSGLHREAELTWHGRNVAVNISQTGCVHIQGKGAGSSAQSLTSWCKGLRAGRFS